MRSASCRPIWKRRQAAADHAAATPNPNLDAVMAQFGLARADGPGGGGRQRPRTDTATPYSLLPDYATATESSALDGVNTSTPCHAVRWRRASPSPRQRMSPRKPLLISYRDAYSKTATIETTLPPWSGRTETVDGPFALAVWARNEDTGAEVLWIGCPNMDNEQLYQSMPGNLTFLQGCAASLVGQDIARGHQGAGSRAHHGGRLHCRMRWA
ncbi:MAG: hypothetical protein ACLVJH_08990 [Faecalibacterium prausnitzii]